MANETSLFIGSAQLGRESKRTLKRLLPRLEKKLSDSITSDPQGWQVFLEHLQTYFPVLFNLYFDLYGTRYDFFFHLEDLLISLVCSWLVRPNDLRALDHAREANWERYTNRNDPHTLKGRVFIGLKNLIELRKRYEVFSGAELEIIPTENEHVLGFTRPHGADRALIFANFSEASQMLLSSMLETQPIKAESLIHGTSNL
jgi:hypothetical protein